MTMPGTRTKQPAAAAVARKSKVSRVNKDESKTTGASKRQDNKSRDETRAKSAETAPLPFDYYLTEGNTYMGKADYNRAIIGYSKALEQKPDHTRCLLLRSNCFLQLGDTKAALVDANNTLKQDKHFIKGLQQKADVLYQMGEFEQALVIYHRGNKLRPELQPLRLGIQLCHGAIENSVGEKAGIKLDKTGDLSFFTQLQQTKESGEKRHAGFTGSLDRENSRGDGKTRGRQKTADVNEKTMKQLLEQLYTDKQYLEELLAETEHVHSKSKATDDVIELSSTCLNYLDTRATFWQQKEPTYSRTRNQQLQAAGGSTGDSDGAASDATNWILSNLRIIDDDQSAGRYSESLERANRVLDRTAEMSDSDVLRKTELEAHLHSYIGNAQLELGQLDEALKHHNQDYRIAKQYNLLEAKSRAIDNIGRVLVRQQKYRDAIKLFQERILTTQYPLERTWLYHEIGRCYLEQDNAKKALEHGEQSLDAANEAADSVWQLNARVLVAQSHVKLREYGKAVETFEGALDLARCVGDKHAVDAIQTAIQDVNYKTSQQHSSKGSDSSEDGEVEVHDSTSTESVAGVTSQSQQAKGKQAVDSAAATPQQPAAHINEPTSPITSPRDEPDKSQEEVTTLSTADSNTTTLPAADSNMTSYKVTVKLSDVENAGSDVTLYIQLVGDKSVSEKVELDGKVSGKNSSRLEAASVNEFNVKATDVGQVKRLIIGHNNTIPGSGPHVAVVHVHSDGQSSTFHCHRWLDKSEDDQVIERELIASAKDQGQVEYKIKVKTGNDSWSGTDSNVFVKLYGDSGETERLPLNDSHTHNNKFETGNTDEFLLQATDVGQLRSIRIGHDDSNMAAAWKLDDVTVERNGTSFHFTANRWLDSANGDKRTEVELLAD